MSERIRQCTGVAFAIVFTWFTGSARAQSLNEVLARARAQGNRLAPFSCAIEAVDYSGAEPIRRAGKLLFRAPDLCRVAIDAGVNLPGGRVTVCAGNTTLIRVPNSGRVQRYYRNLFLDWASGFSGPANFAAFGLSAEQLTREYSILVEPRAAVEGHPAVQITLNETKPRERLVKDLIDAGGVDIQIAYLAYKRRIYLRPPRIRLTIDTDRWLVLKREQFDSTATSAKPTRADAMIAAREVAPGVWFPERYETRNSEGALLATYNYHDVSVGSFGKASAQQDTTQYAVNTHADELIEDAELQPLNVYRQKVDARSKDEWLNLALYCTQWQEDPVEALKYLGQAEEANPSSVAPRALRAQLYESIARYTEAAEQWTRVREARPDYPGVNALIARALLANKDRAGAIAAFNQQLQKDPGDWLSRIALGELMMQDGQYDRAAELYRGALDAATPSTLGRLQAAEDLVVMSRWRNQLPTLASAGDPKEAANDPVLLKMKGDALLFSGNARAAQAEFARIRSRPDTYVVRYAVGQSLERAGLLEEAANVYQELAALGIDTVIGGNSIRRLLALDAAAGRIEAALANLHRLVDNEPSLAARIARRAFFVQYFQKDLRLEQLVNALESKTRGAQPDELAALLLAEAYPLLGRGDKALELVRAGSTKFPRSAWWHSRQAAQLVAEAREKYLLEFNHPQRIALLRAARDASDKAIAADPNLYFEAQRVFIYDAARTEGAKQQAQAAAQAILRKYPNDPDAMLVRAVLERTQKLSDSSAPIPFYREILDTGVPFEDRHQELYFLRQALADSYKKAGRFDESYRQYLLLLDTARNNGDRMQMAMAIMLTAGSQLKKNQPQGAGMIAEMLLRLVRRKDTKANREAVLAEILDPAQFEVLTRMKEMRPLVQADFARRLQSQPNDPYVCLLLGRMILTGSSEDGLNEDERIAQAAELHERAAEYAAQDPDLDAWLAEVWTLRKGYAGAAERLERAIHRDPLRLVDYFTLSNVYVQLTKLNETALMPKRVLLGLPNDTFTLRAAGSLYLKHLGRYDLAVDLYREAHRLSMLDANVSAFDTVDILVYLARAEALNGNISDAEKLFREFAEKAELGKAARVDAYLMLAELYVEAKRYKDALSALHKARDLGPPPEVVKTIDERIKRIEELSKGSP